MKINHEDGSPVEPADTLLQKLGIYLGRDLCKIRKMAGILGNKTCLDCMCLLDMYIKNFPTRTIMPHIMYNKCAPAFATAYNSPKNCPMLLHIPKITREQVLVKMDLCPGCARVRKFCTYITKPNFECSTCKSTFIYCKCTAGQAYIEQRRGD